MLPALLYLASIGTSIPDIVLSIRVLTRMNLPTATGIGLLVETAEPGAAFGQASIIDFGTPFWSLSVSMNVLTTVLIAARLIYRRRALLDSTSKRRARAYYSPEVAIFLESAALYAICSIIYIPMFAEDIPLQFPFSALLGSAAVSAARTRPPRIRCLICLRIRKCMLTKMGHVERRAALHHPADG